MEKFKKKAFAVPLLGIVFLGFAGSALADSNYWHISWNDGDDTPQVMNLDVSNGTKYEFIAKSPSTHQAELWTTDTSLIWNDTQKQLEIGNISQDNIDGLVTDLASKASASSMSTLSSNMSTLNSQMVAANTAIFSTANQPDWNQSSTTVPSFVKNKPSLASVATSGSYNDLSNKPTVGATCYENTTVRNGCISVFKNATVSSGTAVFYLTTDGTSGGTAIFPNGIIEDSIDVEVNDAGASYQMSYALSNSNKTVTVTANKLTTANILTGIIGQTSANGSVIKLMVQGY